MSVSDKILELRTHREAIRQAINDKGVELAEGSPMSDYAGAINEISGGEVNGLVQELVLKNGVVSLEHIGGDTLVLPQEPHMIADTFLYRDRTITTLVNTAYVTKIGFRAFADCRISGAYDFSNLTELDYEAFSFSYLSGDLSFPKLTTLKSTGNYNGQHFQVSKITSINLPLVENIPFRTFFNCHFLEFINIPNVKTIRYDAFYNIEKCEAIVLGETIPIIGGGTAFDNFLTGSYSPNCKLQVPPHMVAAYKADTFWSQHADRIIPYP